MQTFSLLVVSITALANAAVAVADLARARFVVANSVAVHVPLSWLPALGTLKAAGAAGLLLGLAGVPVIGALAAAGLVLFFVGALVAHARAGLYRNIAFPATFLALAAGSLLLMYTR
jgi:DoxX-like family